MMMPANFSAVAENELTYVVGGADLSAYLAPAMKAENWQKFNKNMIMLVGNTYLSTYLGSVLGQVFGGEYRIGAATAKSFGSLKADWKKNMETGETQGWGLLNAVANVGLQVAGNLAAIYALGNGDVGLTLKKTLDNNQFDLA